MSTTLDTTRMVLRPVAPDDLDDLVALDADPAVMRFINGGDPTSVEEMRDEVLPHWLAYETPWGFFAAEDREDGSFLGWFHLRPQSDDPPDRPELGYRLRREVWGRGLATEGSVALVDHAFTELQAREVYATTMAVNTASRRVMEKAGLRFVRLFDGDWPVEIPGDQHGDVEYALTRDDWLAARGSA